MSDGLRYQITKMNGGTHITGYLGEESRPAGQDHPYFTRIKDALVNDNPEGLDDETIFGLFNIPASLKKEFEKISDRVAVEYGAIFYEGEQIHGAVADQILKVIDEDGPLASIVNFTEKIMLNPQEHSREQLYRWLDKHDFDLTDDGDIIVYKGCVYGDDASKAGGKIVSSRSGNEEVIITPADGKSYKVKGKIPQPIGGTVEMARKIVNHNPSQGCSTGLHVGTLGYATGFTSGPWLKCVVSPRDVVSVPTDSGDQKMRVSRYKVIDEVNSDGTSKNAPTPLPVAVDPASSESVSPEQDSVNRKWWQK
jgi:hypothetical protein